MLRLRVQVCILCLCSFTLSHLYLYCVPCDIRPPLNRCHYLEPCLLRSLLLMAILPRTCHIPLTPPCTLNPSPYCFPPLDSTIPLSTDTMDVDSGSAGPSTEGAKRISTHGPRGSRREQWRLSKGMPARPQAKGMNRQGGIAAKRKAGRSHRRR